jgi:hypothetical protein
MYHPETQATITVHPAAVPQYRQSGWLLRSEWEANQAAAADAAVDAAAADAGDAKTVKSEGK